MATEQQHTPAHDPDRLAICANAKIASEIACQFSQGGKTVLVWSDAKPGKERYQWTLYVPRVQRDDKLPEAEDLVTMVAAFRDGKLLSATPGFQRLLADLGKQRTRSKEQRPCRTTGTSGSVTKSPGPT